MIDQTIQQQIDKQLFKKLELAYFCVDRSMRVQDVSSNLKDYGYQDIPQGSKVEDYVDFMVGLTSDTEIDLPLVASPSGIPISVSLMPGRELLTVLISNASTIAEQRQQLQQQANENELLLYQQQKLMAKLEHTSAELEKKNRQLEEASRLQTSFLSGVSHEFRTPLTSIIGYTNLVKRNLVGPEQDVQESAPGLVESDSYLRAVQRSSKHLLSLVENLLDHGKLDSDEIAIRPKPTDLREMFDDVDLVLRPLSDTKSIDFKVSLDIEEGLVAVLDDSRVRQCLINLIGNAIKFTDEGSVLVNARWHNEELLVEIADTGPGISAADLEHIRLPFWQAADTGKAGTGLGLTITERLIDLMGGELNIESELGRGTTVTFNLAAPQLKELAQPDHASNLELGSLKVLLAEDDSDIAELITMMLEERGLKVHHVENGALALGAMDRHSYDLVLMDIHMPIMTGYEAIKALNQSGDDTPIVVMSASAIEADMARAEHLGCRAYLIKPVEIDDIIGIASDVLRDR